MKWPMLAVALVLLSCAARTSPEVACSNGDALCNDVCVPVDRDPQNCGICGRTCAPSDVCASGACSTVCPSTQTLCTDSSGSFCSRLTNDDDNCGACGVVCGVGERCSAGQCDVDCGKLSPCDHACVDLQNDSSNCGACGAACVAACRAGACATPTAIVGGTGHTCALLDDETVSCWGTNELGQLGNETLDYSNVPTPVDIPGHVSTISARADDTCVTSPYGMYCWGDNAFGQLGVTGKVSAPIQQVAYSIAPVGAGSTTCAAIAFFPLAQCWGNGEYGQLGQGNTISSPTPSEVENLDETVTSIVEGEHHICALANGSVWCWGANTLGQLGFGFTDSTLYSASSNGYVFGAKQIVAARNETCALIGDGSVRCWGAPVEGGPLVLTPTTLSNVTNVVTLAAGEDHLCALLANSTVQCWGDNSRGQLGELTGLVGVALIGAGANHTCAALTDGTIECWGANDWGQLGDGTTTDSTKPVRVK